MTLVELMVVLAIFIIITGLVIFDYGSFRSVTSTQNLANDIALSIRKAQSYAIGVRGIGTNFLIRHGVHFSTNPNTSEPQSGSNKSFVLFTDNVVLDGEYNIGECASPSISECQEILTISGADKISGFYFDDSEFLKEGTLDILFERPNPDSIFCYKEDEGDDCLRGFSYVTIKVSNNREGNEEVAREIKVWRTGQIGVNQ